MKFKENIGELAENKKSEFTHVLNEIYDRMRHEIDNTVALEQLLISNKPLERADTKFLKAPEDLTEEIIIRPLLKFLDYDQYHRRTSSMSAMERREADYTLIVLDEKILVEAEPLNKDLNAKYCGIHQVGTWLEKRSFEADYGIATNGFQWILLKYDSEEYKLKVLVSVDLRPLFCELLGQKHLVEFDVLQQFYSSFSSKYILDTAKGKISILERAKEEITKKFYEEYILYVFGVDKKNEDHRTCLLNSISAPSGANEDEIRLFSINLMSRLIFIKFLEDKGLVETNLLRKILNEYKKSKTPNTFYKAYLQTLFYDVFNTNKNKRRSNVFSIELFKEIPYLNGGLFREVVRGEKIYDVENDILEKIIIDLLENYSFTLNDENESLNPDILGNVFEKTINYLTSGGTEKEGTKKRKNLGAYYTPEKITSFISKNTIHPFLFEKIRLTLKELEWKDSDIDLYTSLEDFLDNLPKNPKTIKKIIELIEKIKIIDPACGSGHFLICALKELVFIRKNILEKLEEKINYYHIKKAIINNNLYGVDIEGPAVEITKLRLWLNLIEDLNISDINQIETLPNIEYNIREGNSLIGWLNEKLSQNVCTSPYEDVKDILHALKLTYIENKVNYDNLIEAEDFLTRMDGTFVENSKNAYSKLKEIYLKEEGERAVILKDILEKIRGDIYKSITPVLLTEINLSDRKSRISHQQFERLKPFHWHIDFADIINNGGFDIVLGNPPYGKGQIADFNNLGVYELHDDIYTIFVERSNLFLKDNGFLSFIMPVSWETGERYSKIRNRFFEIYRPEIVVNLPFDIFPEVYVDTCVIVFKKSFHSKVDFLKVFEYGKRFKIDQIKGLEKYYEKIPGDYIYNNPTKKVYMNLFIYELDNRFKSYSKIGDVTRSAIGILASKYEIKDEASTKNYLPFFVGNVYRYQIEKSGFKYINFEKHLETDYVDYYSHPRILIRRIVSRSNRLMATCIKEKFVSKKDLYSFIIINSEYDIHYILALLNSKLFSYLYLNQSALATKDDFRQTTLGEIRDLPVYPASLKQQKVIKNIVKCMIQLKNENEKYNDYANLLDDILDKLIYELYLSEINSQIFDEILHHISNLQDFSLKEIISFCNEIKTSSKVSEKNKIIESNDIIKKIEMLFMPKS